MNNWTYRKTKKIPVQDFYLNYEVVVWAGKTITVEMDLFRMYCRQYMRETKKTKAEVLDDIFAMC